MSGLRRARTRRSKQAHGFKRPGKEISNISIRVGSGTPLVDMPEAEAPASRFGQFTVGIRQWEFCYGFTGPFASPSTRRTPALGRNVTSFRSDGVVAYVPPPARPV